MSFAIDFDRQTRFEAREIEAIPKLRVLAAEAEAGGFPAKLLPEEDFREGHILAVGARLSHVFDGGAQYFGLMWAPSTTTLRVAVPLPVPGRN